MTPMTRKLHTYLQKAGSISQREAMIDLSIGSLSKEIRRLKDHGVEIITEQRKHPATGQRYARYKLVKQT